MALRTSEVTLYVFNLEV